VLPAYPPIATPPTPAAGLDDAGLAVLIRQVDADRAQLLVVANGYTVRALSRTIDSTAWVDLGYGEFAGTCVDAAAPLARRRKVLWATIDSDVELADIASLSPNTVKKSEMQTWVESAERLTRGRGKGPDPKTEEKVAYLAGWRCQFRGCAEDLHVHAGTGTSGRFGYFAHIVASSPKGPRGKVGISHELADSEDNVMLLCDRCHRLIDRVRPKDFPENVLRDMREESIREVRRVLDTLSFDDVQVLKVVGNVSGQTHQLFDRDIDLALGERRLRVGPNPPESFCRLGDQHHDPLARDYWGALFRTLKTDVPRLQAFLNGTSRDGRPRPKLAVFGLHKTSVLLLAGRMLGDAAGTHVFQPHRNAPDGVWNSRWAWPPGTAVPSTGKYRVQCTRPHSLGDLEACLVVSLTFAVDPRRLTPVCAIEGQRQIPTLEVTTDALGSDVIRHPHDLVLLGEAIDKALRQLQDEWRVQKVHLFIGAPASAVVLMGQKMQARNQATFLCHESPNKDAPFEPTIEISGDHVREVGSGQSISLQP
jgi:hypothetical protein